VRRESRHEKKAVTKFGRERADRILERNWTPCVLAKRRTTCANARGWSNSRSIDGRECVDVGENSVELRDKSFGLGLADRKPRELRYVLYIVSRD
jgi:hypothetical protein